MCTPADGSRTGETFDTVLMDVAMPILDGIAATIQLRKMGRQTFVEAKLESMKVSE